MNYLHTTLVISGGVEGGINATFKIVTKTATKYTSIKDITNDVNNFIGYECVSPLVGENLLGFDDWYGGAVKSAIYKGEASITSEKISLGNVLVTKNDGTENTVIPEADVLIKDEVTAAIPRKSVDLTTLAGWEALAAKTYNITIVAKANGFKDSAPSAAVQVEKAPAVVMPNKGDIITLDSKQYRVLKLNGTIAEVLCMYDANSSIKFDSASSNYNNTYAGKNIDTYCNNTFYGGLSAAMKNAIVDKTFAQDSWKRNISVPTESHYIGTSGSITYYLMLVNAAYGSSITRHCYCLSVQDVLDYLEATTSMGTSDTTLTDTNVWTMFWNQSTSSSSTYPWLRSANASQPNFAFGVSGNYGNLGLSGVEGANVARPAFQIDLSKISWSK